VALKMSFSLFDTGQQRFKVKYMPWSTFHKAMLQPQNEKNTWDCLASADCIFGGVDKGISYM
jgi:hypothetical protein